MHYENIPTVRLLIIAEIYGLTAAELSCSVQICKIRPQSRGETARARQLLDLASIFSCSVHDGGILMLFETSDGVRRCLEPSLRCFLPPCVLSPYKSPIQMAAPPTGGLGGARAHLTRAQCPVGQIQTPCACQVGARSPQATGS